MTTQTQAPATAREVTDAQDCPVYLSLFDMVNGRAMQDDAPDMTARDYDASVAIAFD